MEIPVKVTFVGDHAIARMFTRYAKTRMAVLERYMELFGLDQHSREDVPIDGVHVESVKIFNYREVIITVTAAGEKRQRIIEEAIDYLIIARGTGINITEGAETYQQFTIAKAMTSLKGEYEYTFNPIANQIGRSGVHHFLQVRYTSGDKIASLCHYLDNPPGGDIDSIQCVVEIVGEADIPSFIKRVGTPGEVEVKLMAALSTDLDTLYVVNTITYYTIPGAPTDVYYNRYRIGVDGDGLAAWLPAGPDVQLLFGEQGLYFVDTNIDRDGNICCFRTDRVVEPVDISTSEGGLAFGFYPVIPETSPVNASSTRITGSRATIEHYTFNIDEAAMVAGRRRLSLTVSCTSGLSWDYRHAEAIEDVQLADTLNEFYGRGQASVCSGFHGLQEYGNTSPYWRYTHGDFTEWEMGKLVFFTQDGTRRNEDGVSHASNNCSPEGGGSGSRVVDSHERRGIVTFNSIFSCIHIYQDIYMLTMHGELNNSWPYGGVSFFGGGNAYTWIGCPSMSLLPHEWPPGETIRRRDIIHPFEIENIEGVHNAFISHDENTRLTFAGVRYTDAEHEAEWSIRVFGPGFTDFFDITQQVKDAFYGQFWHVFDADGVEIERTEEQKAADFDASFECIYFRAVTKRSKRYVDD